MSSSSGPDNTSSAKVSDSEADDGRDPTLPAPSIIASALGCTADTFQHPSVHTQSLAYPASDVNPTGFLHDTYSHDGQAVSGIEHSMNDVSEADLEDEADTLKLANDYSDGDSSAKETLSRLWSHSPYSRRTGNSRLTGTRLNCLIVTLRSDCLQPLCPSLFAVYKSTSEESLTVNTCNRRRYYPRMCRIRAAINRRIVPRVSTSKFGPATWDVLFRKTSHSSQRNASRTAAGLQDRCV